MEHRSGEDDEGQDRQGVRSFLTSVLSRAENGVDRVREAARELSGSPVLQHALAARERGNLEAAFWLLSEEFGNDPENLDVAVHYWNAAIDLGRGDIASPAVVQLVERHAGTGAPELAAQYWLELMREVPDVFVSPGAIATMLPALKQRLAEAEPAQTAELRGLLRRAMRHAVHPRNAQLHPGVALRLFEEGRELNAEAARRAAEVALDSPNLHEAKRARLQEALTPTAAEPEPEAPPAPTPEPAAPAPAAAPEPPTPPPAPELPDDADLIKRFEGVPIELGDDAVVLQDENGLEVPIAYESIEAISVVQVSGLSERRVAIIDLIRDWRAAADGSCPLRVARMRADHFDPKTLVPGPCLPGDELAAFLGELLERSHAAPLPQLESALGVQLSRYESLADYEREVLKVA